MGDNQGYGRREFLKSSFLFGSAMTGLQVKLPSEDTSKKYLWNWFLHVPSSLMLHSVNWEEGQVKEMMPFILDNFTPMTYLDWRKKTARLETLSRLEFKFMSMLYPGFSDDNSYELSSDYTRISIGSEEMNKLPLIISIDDVGTNWMRYQFYEMFDYLREADNGLPVPVVLACQPIAPYTKTSKPWSYLKEVSDLGWEIATHTIKHFSLLDPYFVDHPKIVEEEITESVDRLEEGIGIRPQTLMGPFGNIYPPNNTLPENQLVYKISQQVGIRNVVGILGGRTRMRLSELEKLAEELDSDYMPEHSPRIPPPKPFYVQKTVDQLIGSFYKKVQLNNVLLKQN